MCVRACVHVCVCVCVCVCVHVCACMCVCACASHKHKYIQFHTTITQFTFNVLYLLSALVFNSSTVRVSKESTPMYICMYL